MNMEEYDRQLNELRDECAKLDQDNINLGIVLRNKEEDIEVHLNLKVELQNVIDSLNQELRERDEKFLALNQKKDHFLVSIEIMIKS